MKNEKEKGDIIIPRIREKKDDTFMFRLTATDEQMLQDLSYRLDRSRSDVLRRALRSFYYAMDDIID